MKEAFKNLKLIFGIDAIIFFFCLSGIIQISEKAKLPFDISQSNNRIFMKSSKSSQYNFLNNTKLYSVGGVSVSNIESVELVTDLKNIGDRVENEIILLIKLNERKLILSNFIRTVIWFKFPLFHYYFLSPPFLKQRK